MLNVCILRILQILTFTLIAYYWETLSSTHHFLKIPDEQKHVFDWPWRDHKHQDWQLYYWFIDLELLGMYHGSIIA